MNHDGRALRERDIYRIQADIYNGLYNDADIAQLFSSLYLQRKILRALFDLYHAEPLRLVSTAEPVRNSTLAHWKELVSMEDSERCSGR